MALSDPASELADHPLAKSAASERRWQKFALMVAHDLKEPIRNIGSCAKLLADMDSEGADAGVDEAQVRQWLVDCSERLVHMMDALVKHAKNGREEFEQHLDLEEVIEGIKGDLRCMIMRTEAVWSVPPPCPVWRPAPWACGWCFRTSLKTP